MQTPICHSLYNLHGDTMAIKASLLVNIAIIKAFLDPDFLSPAKNLPTISFWGNGVKM